MAAKGPSRAAASAASSRVCARAPPQRLRLGALSNSPRSAYSAPTCNQGRSGARPCRWGEVRDEVEQAREREPDDVEVVALDARDERGAAALDGVAAGAALPLAGLRRTSPASAGVGGAEVDLGDLDGGGGDLAVAGEGDRRRRPGGVRPARRARYSRAWAASRGLPRMSPSTATSVSAPSTSVARHRQRLAARVLLGDGDRVAVRLLLDVRRRGRRRRRRAARGSRAAGGDADASAQSSGKNRPASRTPDSGESEPWTMFWPTAIAKSPRIEPVVASSGLVAPITWRAALIASSPSSTIATIGPEVMNVDELAEERPLGVLGVVLLGEVLGHGHVLAPRRSCRPLRSKRAMISPVRPRANASGLTRISVFPWPSSVSASSGDATVSPVAAGSATGSAALGPSRLGGDRRLVRRLAAGAGGVRRRGRRARLGLAERADAPRGVDRLRARVAALLELAHAARAAQEVALGPRSRSAGTASSRGSPGAPRPPSSRARAGARRRGTPAGGRSRRRSCPTNGNSDASVAQTTSIGSSIRRRASAYVQKISARYRHDEDEEGDVDRRLQRVVLDVLDPEDGERRVHVRSESVVGRAAVPLQEGAAEGVAEGEEDQDHERHDERDERDHREDAGAALRSQRARPPRAGCAEQVGDEVDRAGREHGAARAASSRARSTARRGSGSISERTPPTLLAREASVAGGSARGFGRAVKTAADSRGSSARSIPAASLSSRIDSTATVPSGSEAASAAIPGGLWAPSRIVSGSLRDDLQAAGDAERARRPRRRARRRAAAEQRLGGGGGGGEVAALVAGQRATRCAARGRRGAPDDRRAGLARQRHDLRRLVAEHERRARPHHGELLARDVGDRRPEPARVLEPDVGEHDDRRAEHVGRVPAPAEAGLDHRDLDLVPRQLGERGRGQQLELGDALAARQRAVDLRGGRRGALDRGGEVAAAETSASPIRIRSAKDVRCGER